MNAKRPHKTFWEAGVRKGSGPEPDSGVGPAKWLCSSSESSSLKCQDDIPGLWSPWPFPGGRAQRSRWPQFASLLGVRT